MSQSSSNSETIDDASGRITYNPGSAWILDTTLGAYQPNNGTIHSTTQSNASATLTFTGNSIAVTCLMWPTGANISITLDSQQMEVVNTGVASLSDATPKVIWSKDNLSGSTHTVVISKVANDPNWVSSVAGDEQSHLSLDSFTVGGESSSDTGSNTTSTPSKSSTNSTPIIIGVVLGVIALIVLFGAFWYIRRRRQRNQLVLATPETADESEKRSQLNDLSVLSNSSAAALSTGALLSQPQQRRNEKMAAEGAMDPNGGERQNDRGIWPSSLLGLPNGRVVRLNSFREPSQSEDQGAATTSSQEERTVDPTRQRHESHPMTDASLLRSPIPETTFSTGSESLDSPSTIPPSTHQETSTPLPLASSPQTSPAHNEKSAYSGPRGQTSAEDLQDSATASFHTSAVSATSSSNRDGDINARALLRELVDLRQQVRTLAQLHQTRGTSDVYHDEPPPEYEGRDRSSDGEDEHDR